MSKFATAEARRAERRATLPANAARIQQRSNAVAMHRVATSPIPGTAAYAADRFGSGRTDRHA